VEYAACMIHTIFWSENLKVWRQLERTKRIYEDNIKTNRKDTDFEGGLSSSGWDKDHWQILLNTVINLRAL
jgi:hypothetical protein